MSDSFVGVSADDSSDFDPEYVSRLIQKSRKNNKEEPDDFEKYYYGKPPPPMPQLKQMRQSLSQKLISSDLPDLAYISQRFADRGKCVFHCIFETHDREVLRLHLLRHKEFQQWKEFWQTSESTYDAMRERLQHLREMDLSQFNVIEQNRARYQIQKLRSDIERFRDSADTSPIAKKGKTYLEAKEIFRLIGDDSFALRSTGGPYFIQGYDSSSRAQ